MSDTNAWIDSGAYDDPPLQSTIVNDGSVSDNGYAGPYYCKLKRCDFHFQTTFKTVHVQKHVYDGQPIDYVRTIEWPLVVLIGVLILAVMVVKAARA